MDNVIAFPIMEDKPVQELVEIVKKAQINVDAENFINMLQYMSEMEKRLVEVENNIKFMKQTIDTLEYEVDHPILAAYGNAAEAISIKFEQTKESFNSLKNKIIEGCKNTVNAFKDKGTLALNTTMNFLHIKEGLEDLKSRVNRLIELDEQSIVKIEKASAEYHEAGKHIRNAGRALMGIEALETAKPSGLLCVALKSPYEANKVISKKIKSICEAVIGSLDRLSSKTVDIKEQSKKPEKESVMKLIAENKEKVREQSIKNNCKTICL